MFLMGCALTDSRLQPPPRGGSREAERAVRCGGCARSYELASWHALPLVGILTGDAIAAHVVKWPYGLLIEVRRCARCSRSIARTVEPQPA
jgi:hypothetical protein